ncbi:MAG TPA: nucleotidyltransferase [Nitrospirae bacterium]|nr:nucleotidyltransferase domain protein [bacterium BMS3Bbin08]HDH33957.1 nucleotidyltransferase [Nitrospirota bacterium]HDH51689.1 nucleotidyltransferase [Nitrospirota bacterium]HDK17328.1 nucleotidyltransferase [Nitrospirota bacterium]
MVKGFDVPKEALADFCSRWMITEFALFGSALRDDFSHDSDIDVLVTFSPDASWSLLDHVQMQDELEILFRRDVDLVTRKGIERSRNHIRREEILKSAEVIYAAA